MKRLLGFLQKVLTPAHFGSSNIRGSVAELLFRGFSFICLLWACMALSFWVETGVGWTCAKLVRPFAFALSRTQFASP